MKTNEEYRKENRALRWDIKRKYQDGEGAYKTQESAYRRESAIKNLKAELLKA